MEVCNKAPRGVPLNPESFRPWEALAAHDAASELFEFDRLQRDLAAGDLGFGRVVASETVRHRPANLSANPA
jgi:hypothetical protein